MTGREEAILAMVVDCALKKLPTIDLVAELERRRPKCVDCSRCDDICTTPCLWAYEFKEDNFQHV
jgi:formate hydrogenlyase subunit 6/NADH:ubiquinone oxidoreductase subunit I